MEATQDLRKVSAPSQLKNKMGAHLFEDGCMFRVWIPFASSVSVKLWDSSNSVKKIPLDKDSAEGYGNQCWSAFVPDIKENTDYRFAVTYKDEEHDYIDPYGPCIHYPNWKESNQDDSDARSRVVDLSFQWNQFTPPPANEMIIYQLHIGTFYDNNPTGPGGLNTILNKLDYLKNMGINAVQLMPFTEFSSAFSMGYNSMLPFAIESDYGVPKDLKTIIDACHKKGIALLFDVIFNHIDIGRPPKPYSLADYGGFDSDQYPDGIYFYDMSQIATPWGPRPNYSKSEVRKFLRDNALTWLTDYNADGLRFDSTKCIRLQQGNCSYACMGPDIGDGQRNFGWELMQEINNEIDQLNVQKLTIAEDLDNNTWITGKTSSGGAGFDSQWDCNLRGAVRSALTQAFDNSIDLSAVAYAIQNPIGKAFNQVIYLSSHDEDKYRRMPDEIYPGNAEGWHARKKTMLGMGVIMTSPGIPMIFQGNEFLDWHTWSDQTPLDWNQLTRFPKYNHFFSDLFELRTNRDNLTRGLCGENVNVIQANPFTKVLAYHRWDKGFGIDDVIVVANFSCQAYQNYVIGLPYSGKWIVRLNSDANVYSDSNDFNSVYCADVYGQSNRWDNMPYSGSLAIGPYSIVILSRERFL